MGIFDQDVDDIFSVRFPLLYTPGLIDLLFNKFVFLKSVAHGIITSFVLFFVSYGAFKNAVGPEGINLDGHQIFGTVVSTILVIVVTAQVCFSIELVEKFVITILITNFLDCIGHILLDCIQPYCHMGQHCILLCINIVHQ